MARTRSLRTQWARHRVDHGTICGRSYANSGHHKPLCACVDNTFINPNSSGRRPENLEFAPRPGNHSSARSWTATSQDMEGCTRRHRASRCADCLNDGRSDFRPSTTREKTGMEVKTVRVWISDVSDALRAWTPRFGRSALWWRARTWLTAWPTHLPVFAPLRLRPAWTRAVAAVARLPASLPLPIERRDQLPSKFPWGVTWAGPTSGV